MVGEGGGDGIVNAPNEIGKGFDFMVYGLSELIEVCLLLTQLEQADAGRADKLLSVNTDERFWGRGYLRQDTPRSLA